jgi:hypothetical protein
MTATDYDALAARAFDEPYDGELLTALRVCGDALEQAGDPRGPLIALEHAVLEAESPARARELRRALHAYAFGGGAALLGPAAAPESFAGELELEWRAGKIYGAAVECRYLDRKEHPIRATELVNHLLDAPGAYDLRRLRVRVSQNRNCEEVMAAIHGRDRRPPLEEIEVGAGPRPRRISWGNTSAMLDKYPDLYFLAHRDQIRPLAPADELARPAAQRAVEVEAIGPPTEPRARAILGRALCSHDEVLRGAALRRIAAIGPPARGFAYVMTRLLAPGIQLAGAPIIEALCALAPSRELALICGRISSRDQHYDVETRRAAGAAAARIRRALGER